MGRSTHENILTRKFNTRKFCYTKISRFTVVIHIKSSCGRCKYMHCSVVTVSLLVMVSSELVVLLIVCVGINTGSAQPGESEPH